tara:strand:- start:164 stop:472 length:309 start_codon:yes stop_codon:yes gene_type:complete
MRSLTMSLTSVWDVMRVEQCGVEVYGADELVDVTRVERCGAAVVAAPGRLALAPVELSLAGVEALSPCHPALGQTRCLQISGLALSSCPPGLCESLTGSSSG